MVVRIKIWAEASYQSLNSNWEANIKTVRSHIEQALNDFGMDNDVTPVTDTHPDMPDPLNLYNSSNSDEWDKWLDNNNAYAEDSNILLMSDKGGATFSSGRNSDTTTDGCMTLLGGQDLNGTLGVQTQGKSEHYHDIYNGLHELSHALDAPTGSSVIGQYYDDSNGEFHRTPAQTFFDADVTCGLYHNPANQGNTWWDLTYYGCTQNYLTDQS